MAVEEMFSYLACYAPNFPAEDETNAEEQFKELLASLEDLRGSLHDVERRRWLDLVLQETRQAWAEFLAGNEARGQSLLGDAKDHFDSWRGNKRIRTTFVAGVDGLSKKTE